MVAADERRFPAGLFADRFAVQQVFTGGEGETAHVRDKDTGAELVVKLLPVQVPPDEASLLLTLRHPRIPEVREVGRLPDGRAFVVRRFQPGRTLTEALPLSPATALQVCRDVLETLAFVHLRSVLHLDLKPANLVLADDGSTHLLDFGLGVRAGQRGRGGTPFFAAPEVLLGGTPDARSDLFSLGAVLVALLWPGPGKLPLQRFLTRFPGESFWSALDTTAAAFPAPFPAFLERCLHRQPARRFHDAQAALEFLVGGSGRPARTLLAPDVVSWHGERLLAAAAQAGAADLLLHGGTASSREQLGLHLACALPDVKRLEARADGLLLHRHGAGPRHVAVPPPDPGAVANHLANALALTPEAADLAARWLLARGEDVGDQLGTLLDEGEIVPAGSRFSWPRAAQGRLSSEPRPAVAEPPAATAAMVRRAIERGQTELALRLYRRLTGHGIADGALRAELVRALLLAGDPAVALPLCVDLPALRAQTLCDLGRIDEAAAVLPAAIAAVGSDPAARRALARTAVRLRAARGDASGALADLRAATAGAPDLAERQTEAALLESLGDIDAARAVLVGLLAEPDAAQQPFLRAAALTSLGLVERRRGDLTAAADRLEQARALLFRLGHARHAATAASNLGVVARDRGDFAGATAHLRSARTLFEHIGDAAGAAIADANLGITELAAGDPVAAARRLEPAIATLRRLGHHDAAAMADAALRRARMTAPGATTVAASTPTVQDDAPSRELFRTFLAVNRRLAQETDLDRAMVFLLEAAVTLCGGRQGFLLIERQDGLRREFQTGDGAMQAQAFSRSLANRALQLNRTLTGDDALADRDLQEMPSIRNLQVRSAICAPFRSASGAAGAIYVEHGGRAQVFSSADKQSLEVLADQAAIAVDRLQREEALAQELESNKRELQVVRREARRPPLELIGDSEVMRQLRAQIDRLAANDLSVLVLGETGTGKELVARSLHARGPRSRGPFVAENCSALPAELMERELFGHVRGAFTGAEVDKPGLFEMANGGTLFLDEVGDMPPAMQVRLLRALQERSIRRIGGERMIPVDLRLVTATHKDLRAMVARGEFREDLYFRLAALEVRVPPLRERDDDVLVLARWFLDRLATQHGKRKTLTEAALQRLRQHRWPGNVRELEHTLARAWLLADGDAITAEHLPQPVPTPPAAAPSPSAAQALAGAAAWPVLTLAEAERRTVLAALASVHGDKTKAARVLGISRTALYEKLKRHGHS